MVWDYGMPCTFLLTVLNSSDVYLIVMDPGSPNMGGMLWSANAKWSGFQYMKLDSISFKIDNNRCHHYLSTVDRSQEATGNVQYHGPTEGDNDG